MLRQASLEGAYLTDAYVLTRTRPLVLARRREEYGCFGTGEPDNELQRRGCVPPPGICVNPGEMVQLGIQADSSFIFRGTHD